MSSVSVEENLKRSRHEFEAGKHTDALNILGEMSLAEEEAAYLEGTIFNDLGVKSGKRLDEMFTFLLASVESYSRIPLYRYYSAIALFDVAERFSSALYYKKSRKEATIALDSVIDSDREQLELIIGKKIDVSETRSFSKVDLVEHESELYSELEEVKSLKTFWIGLSAEAKKEYMKVSILKMKDHFEEQQEGRCVEALLQVIKYVKKHERWILWICRSCKKTFSTNEGCKLHLENDHNAKVSPLPQMVSKLWLDKVLAQTWGDDVDEERTLILNNIRTLLVSLRENNIFSHSIRDVLISLVVKNSEEASTEPEALDRICFLECKELNQVLDFLRKVKCTRDDGASLVCRAVNSYCVAGFRGSINFSSDYSHLLLDKRLLRGEVERFDDKGVASFLDPQSYYGTIKHPCGDYFVTWLDDYTSNQGGGTEFPSPPSKHHLSVWVSLLRVIHLTCRILQGKCAKKQLYEDYIASLTQSREFFKDKSLLCTECQKSDKNEIFLCAVRDVVKEGEPCLTPFVSPILADLLDAIHTHQVNDDATIKKIDHLHLLATQKVALTESKMLLIEASRSLLVDKLVRLSFFDYRSYIQQPLKEFVMALLMHDAERGN